MSKNLEGWEDVVLEQQRYSGGKIHQHIERRWKGPGQREEEIGDFIWIHSWQKQIVLSNFLRKNPDLRE